ncbi:hypothetical protein GCM10011578_003130 [Streptomyces fuscichromogenes]|uniref:Uncharacterized protein n=1 Tax=Streptomyces fuscichromogenes TaxID=1324013 RepID=A0A917UH97_9ACTN|nr:hypothetical protein GCM10011578_003130 [Streptomyces fuscichromogenes]
MKPEAGPSTKIRQHTAIRVYVMGADVPRRLRRVRTAVVFQLPIMDIEHGVTGRTGADRLAAVDRAASSTRQAVGLRATRVGTARHGH